MKRSPLAQDLRLKAKRALSSARELKDRDPDGSVNRSYYAMFDMARAALLSAGAVAEPGSSRAQELLRTRQQCTLGFLRQRIGQSEFHRIDERAGDRIAIGGCRGV